MSTLRFFIGPTTSGKATEAMKWINEKQFKRKYVDEDWNLAQHYLAQGYDVGFCVLSSDLEIETVHLG